MMAPTDKRINAYITRSADFAQPILRHLRRLVHKASPDVEETTKWGFPHFQYAGGILCSMAAFKHHCAFGFWKASIMPDPKGILSTIGRTSMGHLGRITRLSDLPPDNVLVSYIREAARLNEEQVRVPCPVRPRARKPVRVPAYFMKALKKSKAALAEFERLSPSYKREYLEWITEAKREETRARRIETTIQWLVEGKARNWKYKKR